MTPNAASAKPRRALRPKDLEQPQPRKPAKAGIAPEDFRAKREGALTRLRYQADSMSAVADALRSLIAANLGLYGLALQVEVKATYNPYAQTCSGRGGLGVAVKGNWSQLKTSSGVHARQLLEGLPAHRLYSFADDGQPLRNKPDDHVLSYTFPLAGEGELELVRLKAVLDQERALSQALQSVRAAQELAGVQQTMRGTGSDQKVLAEESALNTEITELEEKLEEKRKALQDLAKRADVVRKNLREADSPASATLRAQLNLLRSKLGMMQA